jgi:hypothetical protein
MYLSRKRLHLTPDGATNLLSSAINILLPAAQTQELLLTFVQSVVVQYFGNELPAEYRSRLDANAGEVSLISDPGNILWTCYAEATVLSSMLCDLFIAGTRLTLVFVSANSLRTITLCAVAYIYP